jgi:hypothetical protein
MAPQRHGSIARATGWMFGLLILLFWLPGLGPLIAGFVGGRKAGGVGAAILAVVLPIVAAGVALAVLGSHVTGIPVLGLLVGLGGIALILLHAGALLIGAIIGGLLS